MKLYTTPLRLAEKLIALPSYVDEQQDETQALEWLATFLEATFPEMKVQKQYLNDSRRYNLLLKGKRQPKLLVLGHLDTVQPKQGWGTDPFKPVVKNGKLYGLGAADMKSSLATFLWALAEEKADLALDELAILIYIDEEYDFQGIKRFLAEDLTPLTPQMTLSLDGSLAVATGCRGLIELSLTIKGRSGHASNPANGVNAITRTVAALEEVANKLTTFVDVDLGPTTTNLAALQGGTVQKAPDGTLRWLEAGNVIPDTVRAVFEVRPSTPAVNARMVVQMAKQLLQQQGLTLAEATIRHDIRPWPVNYDPTSLDRLKRVYAQACVPLRIADRKLQGYIDAQMVAETIAAPTFIIGTGGNNKHGANENVPLKNLERATAIYRALLREVLA